MGGSAIFGVPSASSGQALRLRSLESAQAAALRMTGFVGGLKEDKGNWSGDGLLGFHFFVGGDELPAPGFGQVFEVWVLGAD